MAELQNEVAGVATGFAEISSKAAVAGNARRLAVAEGNINAAQSQIDLEKSQNRRSIAQALAQYQGQQAAGRAFRGASASGSGFAIGDAATAQAADQAAIVEANAAAKEVAVIASNQVSTEDPVLAAIQGGVQGLNIGTQIAQALIEEAEVVTRQSSQQLLVPAGSLPTFQNYITTSLDIPGLDLGSIFNFG